MGNSIELQRLFCACANGQDKERCSCTQRWLVMLCLHLECSRAAGHISHGHSVLGMVILGWIHSGCFAWMQAGWQCSECI